MQKLIWELPEQIESAVSVGVEGEILDGVKGVLIGGMGGSAIGGDLLSAILRMNSNVPVYVNRDYVFPRWVQGKDWLCVCVSYSGNTEETLSMYELAKAKGCKIGVITSGGKLGEWARKDKVPLCTIPGGYPPRAAIGYTFFPLVRMVFSALGMEFPEDDVAEVVSLLKEVRGDFSSQGGPPARLASEIKDKLPVIYSDERLGVVTRRWVNQINENAKALAHFNIFPELNHNEIVGYMLPHEVVGKSIAMFLRDGKEHDRVSARMRLTGEILARDGVRTVDIYSKGQSLLARIFYLVYFGDFLSYFLARLYGVDPVPVERIAWLKEKLRGEK